MKRTRAVQPLADPYFHDIIREMEAIEPKAPEGVKRREFIKLAGATGAG